MRLKYTTMFITMLILIFSLSAWAVNQAEPTEAGLITVTGDAEVRVVPDEVILTLGVETWDKELAVAKRQNDERVKEVLALIQNYGIEPKYIQTDHLSIEPQYRDSYEKNDLIIGYFVRKTIVITLKDITKFEDLLTSALEAEVNYVHGIQFRTTELRKYRDQARALAIKAAQEKAEALAQELGQNIGTPHTIQENQTGWWSSYNAWWGTRFGGRMTQNVVQEVGGDFPSSEGSIAPGQITVNASVTASFELE